MTICVSLHLRKEDFTFKGVKLPPLGESSLYNNCYENRLPRPDQVMMDLLHVYCNVCALILQHCLIADWHVCLN
jgi:hypothetical protein